MAYLALERFRYRENVEATAAKLYARYESDIAIQAETSLDLLNELRWWCRRECNGHVPSGFVASLYRALYRRSADVILMLTLAASCAFTLAVGVAHEIGLEGFSQWPKSWGVTITLFWLCLLAIAAPVVAVAGGRWCVSVGKFRAKHLEDQIATALRLTAVDARLPDIPANGNVGVHTSDRRYFRGEHIPRPGAIPDRA